MHCPSVRRSLGSSVDFDALSKDSAFYRLFLLPAALDIHDQHERRYTMPPRSPVLLMVLAAMGVLILPALYTHHRDPTYIPSLFHSSLPAHIVVPSGGNNDLPMTLEARLTDLLARPALEQWEAELASRHGCPFYTYSRNTYFFHTEDKVRLWEGISKSDIRRYRSKMVEYLRNVEREGQKLVWEKGMDDHVPLDRRRGLIFTGGKGVSPARATGHLGISADYRKRSRG